MAQGAGKRGSRSADDSPQQADDEVSDAGEHLRTVALAHLAAVFVESDVSDPVKAVLDAPVAAVERQKLTGRGACWVEIGDAADPLDARGAAVGVGDVALDLAGLSDVGEIEIVVEDGGGADRPLLDAPVGLIEGGVLRGEWIANRTLRDRRRGASDCPSR